MTPNLLRYWVIAYFGSRIKTFPKVEKLWAENWFMILRKKRILVGDRKFNRRSQSRRRKWTGRDSKRFRRRTSNYMINEIYKHTCNWSSRQTSFPLAVFFQRSTKKMGATSSLTQCRVFKRAKTYSVLRFSLSTFWFHFKAFVMCYCFCEPIKTFFLWRLSSNCQIACPALVSGSPKREAMQ